MKKIYILTLLLCFISFGNSFAQTLKGHIYDAKTNEPLVGAAVTYKLQGNQGVVSDINGAYEIKLPEGGVDLVFSYVGYEDVLMPIVIDRREVVTKDVYMRESTKLLEEVVVSAGRFDYHHPYHVTPSILLLPAPKRADVRARFLRQRRQICISAGHGQASRAAMYAASRPAPVTPMLACACSCSAADRACAASKRTRLSSASRMAAAWVWSVLM